MSKLIGEKIKKQSELDEINKKIEIINEFIKCLKSGDIVYIPEISYDPFCNGYHPLEVQSTSEERCLIYCIERSIMKEHYIEDLYFYLRDASGEFVSSSLIDNVGEINKICKINRKFK